MDAECDNCRIWAHAKCEMITKQEYKAGFLPRLYTLKHFDQIWKLGKNNGKKGIKKELKEMKIVQEKMKSNTSEEVKKIEERTKKKVHLMKREEECMGSN